VSGVGRRGALRFLAGALAVPAWANAQESDLVFPEAFGASADGRTDDTHAINAADLWCAEQGRPLHFRGDYYVEGQLLHSDNVQWIGLGATIWSGRTSVNPEKSQSATLRSRRSHPFVDFYRAFRSDATGLLPSDVARGCVLSGDLAFRWAPQALEFARRHGAATRMCMAYYLCHDFRIDDGVVFDCGYGDWTIAHWGDRFSGRRFRIEGGNQRPIYSDGFHSFGGDNGRIIGAEVSSGDDSFALANTFGQRNRSWQFIDCAAYSRLASGFKLSVGRLGLTATFPHAPSGRIEDIEIAGARWMPVGPSRNGFFRVDTGGRNVPMRGGVIVSRAEDRTLVRNVTFDGTMDARNEGLPRPVYPGEPLPGGMPAISNAGGSNVRIRARVRNAALWVAVNEGGEDISYDLDSPDPPNWTGTPGGICAVECRPLYDSSEQGDRRRIIYRATRPRLNGSIRGGNRGLVRLVEVEETFADQLRLHGIPDGFQGVDMSQCDGPNSFTVSDYLELVSATGATSSFGLKVTGQSRVAIRNLYAGNVHLIRGNPSPVLLRVDRRLSSPRS